MAHIASATGAFAEPDNHGHRYDVNDLDSLRRLQRRIGAILISTSSDLFRQLSSRPLSEFGSLFNDLGSTSVVLKENRGGARVFHDGRVEPVPALLGKTVNSVGVGDVFSAAYVGLQELGIVEAAWRAGRARRWWTQLVGRPRSSVVRGRVRR